MQNSRNNHNDIKKISFWGLSIYWVILGFLIAYFLFFINPIFLNTSHEMLFFRYVPNFGPVGIDLKQMLSFCESWSLKNGSPYIGGNLYPPLATIIFTPLLNFEFQTAYTIITWLNFLGYLSIMIISSLLICKSERISPVIIFIFVTGLFSYGFQFELERGQCNIIVMTLCLLSIYLYHKNNAYRYLAYLLFSVSIQLKVYPAIFVVAFTRDLSDWKNNMKRFFGIGLFNLMLLFVLGFRTFIEFLRAIKTVAANPSYIWVGNHSIMASSKFMGQMGIIRGQPAAIEAVLLSIFGLCFGMTLFMMFKQKSSGLNPNLLLTCTIGTLIIPAISHDYKLSILPPAMAVFLGSIDRLELPYPERLLQILMTITVSAAYSFTLFSYTNKFYGILIRNNLLPIMIVLVASNFMTYYTGKKKQ